MAGLHTDGAGRKQQHLHRGSACCGAHEMGRPAWLISTEMLTQLVPMGSADRPATAMEEFEYNVGKLARWCKGADAHAF